MAKHMVSFDEQTVNESSHLLSQAPTRLPISGIAVLDCRNVRMKRNTPHVCAVVILDVSGG